MLVLIGAVALSSCSAGNTAYEFYVVLKPGETSKFLETVTAVAKDEGLEIAAGQAAADTGDVLRVVEGRGRGVKLWVQNTLLSGKEDPRLCGKYSEPRSDPVQFTVFTEPRFFGSRETATKVGEQMLSQIEKAGFDVRRKPAVCGKAAIPWCSRHCTS